MSVLGSFGFAFLISSFVVFPVQERECKVIISLDVRSLPFLPSLPFSFLPLPTLCTFYISLTLSYCISPLPPLFLSPSPFLSTFINPPSHLTSSLSPSPECPLSEVPLYVPYHLLMHLPPVFIPISISFFVHLYKSSNPPPYPLSPSPDRLNTSSL